MKPTYFSKPQQELVQKALGYLDISPLLKSEVEKFLQRTDVKTEDTILFCGNMMKAAYFKHDGDFCLNHLEREQLKYRALAEITNTLVNYKNL